MEPEAALDALRLVLRPLIIFEHGGLAPDRPVHAAQITVRQPVLLRQARMSEAGRDGDGRGALQRNRKAENGPAVDIDGEGDVWPADDGPVMLARQADVARRAVDLHTCPGRRGTGIGVGEQSEGAGLAPSLAAPRQPELITGAHTRSDRLATRCRKARSPAAPGNLAGETAQVGAGAPGIVPVDRLLDDRLRSSVETLRAGCVTGRQKLGDSVPADADLPHQRPDAPRGDAERIG